MYAILAVEGIRIANALTVLLHEKLPVVHTCLGKNHRDTINCVLISQKSKVKNRLEALSFMD